MRISDLDAAVPQTESGGGSPGRDTSAYRVQGERVPSVTEVLELAGMTDIEALKAVAGADVVEFAARRGSVVHGFCDLVDLDDQFDRDTIPKLVRGYVEGYVAWKDATGFEPVHVERIAVSRRLAFGGTVDRIGLFPNGAVALIDLKTPQAHADSWRLQTAGYEIAVEESGLTVVNRRGVVQLRPDGKFREVIHDDPSDLDTFLAALRVAHYRLAHGLAQLED